MITAYFSNVVHMMTQLTDASTIVLALNESAKIVPYITSSRKMVKVYLKACLTFWSSGSGGAADDGGDSVRIAAFLAIRRLTRGGDPAIMELVLKVIAPRRTLLQLLTVLLGHIHNSSSLFKVYQRI